MTNKPDNETMPDEIFAYASYVSTGGRATQGHGWRDASNAWNAVNEIMDELYEPSWSLADKYIKKSQSISKKDVEKAWSDIGTVIVAYGCDFRVANGVDAVFQALLSNNQEGE